MIEEVAEEAGIEDRPFKSVFRNNSDDAMGQSEVGSPFKGEDYPIIALYNLDNTYRLPYGVEQIGASYSGMSITSAPAPEPGEKSSCTCTDYCANGVCCCEVWICQ